MGSPRIHSVLHLLHSDPLLCKWRTRHSSCQASDTVGVHGCTDSSDLPIGKQVAARLVRVIHVGVNAVHATSRTRVLARWAASRHGGLRRSIVDIVTTARATTLEDVVETCPVANLMN